MAGKKDFSKQQNPAMTFITPQEAQEAPVEEIHEEAARSATEGLAAPQKGIRVEKKDIPAGYKVNPLFVEIKSRRLQLLVQPSIYEAIKEQAKAKGISVNEFAHRALEKAVKEN